MNNQACKRCRYWDHDDTVDTKNGTCNSLINIKLCTRSKLLDDCREYKRNSNGEAIEDDLMRYSYEIKPEYKDQMLFSQDGSSYRADVYTREDFYCAHFEPREV